MRIADQTVWQDVAKFGTFVLPHLEGTAKSVTSLVRSQRRFAFPPKQAAGGRGEPPLSAPVAAPADPFAMALGGGGHRAQNVPPAN